MPAKVRKKYVKQAHVTPFCSSCPMNNGAVNHDYPINALDFNRLSVIPSLQFSKLICRFGNKVLSLQSKSKKRMIIANKILLDDFIQSHVNALKPINKWLAQVTEARWKSHAELKRQFPPADYVKNGRYVFNIGGNKFRIVAVVVFIGGVMNIRFVGTHTEYDRIDCATI